MTNDSRRGGKNRGERKEYKQKKQEYKQKAIGHKKIHSNNEYIAYSCRNGFFFSFLEKQLSISRLPLIGLCAENIGTLVSYHQLEFAFF